MVRRSPVLASASLLALALASAACVAVLGLDKLSEKPDSESDAATPDVDAPPDGRACSTGVGEAPKNTPPGSLGSLVFALREIDLGIERAADAGTDGADAGPAGLDLDERTTSDLTSSSCTFPKNSPTISEYGMDLACGVDNASRNLVKLMAVSSAAMRPESINARLLGGYFGFALAVDDWNGATDDEHVIVRAFPTLGIGQLFPDGGVRLQATPPALAPADLWIKDRRFARLSDASSLTSDRAWVKDGRIVAHFETLVVPIRTSTPELMTLDIKLQDTWMTASLAPPGAGGDAGRSEALSRGMISGRLPIADFLEQMGFLSADIEAAPNKHLCKEDRDTLTFVAMAACGGRDIRALRSEDSTGLPCNAVSFAARFETYPVDTLGPAILIEDDAYRDAGLTPPNERCQDATPVECAP